MLRSSKSSRQHIWEKEDGFDSGPHVNDPIGSGPFMLEDWQRGSHVTLRANPDYFRGKPKIDMLIFKVVSDANVARAEFDANSFPYLPYDYAPSSAEVPALEQDPSPQVVFTPSHYGRDIQLNLRRSPLDDLAVREAIARAIDRETMNRLGFSGYWKLAYNAIVDSRDKKSQTFPGSRVVAGIPLCILPASNEGPNVADAPMAGPEERPG